jgi:hypothetical protein
MEMEHPLQHTHTHIYIYISLDFHTFSGMNCVQKLGTACKYWQFRGTHVTRRQLKCPINSCLENENNEETNSMLFLTFRFSLFTSHNSNCSLFPASQLLLQWKRFSSWVCTSNTFFQLQIKHHFVTNIYSVHLDVPCGGYRD